MTQSTTHDEHGDAVERVLQAAERRAQSHVFGSAQALQDAATAGHGSADGEQWDLSLIHI